VVVFPGNPGSALFYIPYMRYLHEVLHPRRLRVRAVSNIGHSRDVYSAAHYTLEDQVCHKVEYLLKHCTGPQLKRTPLLVIGHSIGGHMAIEAVKRLRRKNQCTKPIKVLALMPYLQFDESSRKQRWIRTIAQAPRIPATFASILGTIPKSIAVPLIKAFDKHLDEESAQYVANQLFSYTVSHNAFSLAHSEFSTLTKDIDWQWLGENSDDLGFVFCPGDHWAPRKLHDELRQRMPKDCFLRYEEDQFHGFVTHGESSRAMAHVTAAFLQHTEGKTQGGGGT